MRRVTVLFVVIAVLALPALGVAQEELFHDGNQRYQEGDFEGALQPWLAIMDAGFESGELYYNLGNAYFKIGDLGRSILYYERARRLMPADDNLRANLELARSLTADEIMPLPGFWLFHVVRWWRDLLPRGALLLLVSAGWLVVAAAVIGKILDRGLRRRAASRVAAGAALVTLLFGITLVARETKLGQADEAIILAPEVMVRSAPSDDPALLLFTIHEGARVRLDRRSADWVEVFFEDGKVGWVPAVSLEII